jgi:PIN domain nuclease of toxin-antitoxin system
MKVLDASAALAFLQGENLAEVLTRLAGAVEHSLAEAILVGSGVRSEVVSADEARRSADIKDSAPGLSLGDRLCLALADRRDDLVLTADQAWGKSGRILQIR